MCSLNEFWMTRVKYFNFARCFNLVGMRLLQPIGKRQEENMAEDGVTSVS